MRRASLLVLPMLVLAFAACRSESPPEPDAVHADPAAAKAVGTAVAAKQGAAVGPTRMQVAQVPVSPDDPVHGQFNLADAEKGLKGNGDLSATIETSHGTLTCKLFADKAPITVANFVGLARGTRPWKDPANGQWVTRPAYDGTTFHRIIKGFMIQGGDPKGDGSGEPGYVIPDEIWPGATHDHAGELCMANRGPNTNGAQFFITDAAAPHLDKGYTILGECGPVAAIHMIASVATGPGDKPVTPVEIRHVTITRGGK